MAESVIELTDATFDKTVHDSDVPVLVDFWATWCGPCKAGMKAIHDMYDKYKDKNFTIVSISLDTNINLVKEYRNERWHMPWVNVLAKDRASNDLAKTFEVYAVPKMILVDPEGIILNPNYSLFYFR